jgi:hypothetical protein
MTGLAAGAAVSQPIRVLHGLWVCGSCMAGVNNGVILHYADCGWLAEIAAAERDRIRELAERENAHYGCSRPEDYGEPFAALLDDDQP